MNSNTWKYVDGMILGFEEFSKTSRGIWKIHNRRERVMEVFEQERFIMKFMLKDNTLSSVV